MPKVPRRDGSAARSSEKPAEDVPKTVKFFRHFGLDAEAGSNGHLHAECPFCRKEGKFSASTDRGLWDCKSCGKSGNPLTFMRQLWDASDASTADYGELAEDRRLLFPETLMSWGLARSVLTGRWLAAACDVKGNVCQVYRYEPPGHGKKPALLANDKDVVGTGMGVGLFGVPLYDPRKPEVWICEGPWDGAALWEVLRMTKRTEEGRLVPTASEASSLLADVNVLAVPGAGTFPEPWAALCGGKKVTFLFDNDHPKTLENGVVSGLAGMRGTRAAAVKLALSETPPSIVCWLSWGEEGYDPGLPSGFDVRDLLTSEGLDAASRRAGLSKLLSKTVPIPEKWIAGRSRKNAAVGCPEIECVPCKSWRTLRTAWQEAMKWSPGLDRALAVMLASVTSTKAVGDQLWVKIVSPPSTGKSVLCEALAVNKRYVLPKSTIRGFHSGFKSDAKGHEDNSLLAQARDKTLVTKDGDTLLQAPNVQQILSEARDVYDRTSRTHYRNKMSRDYEQHDMTWILCGTSSLRALDSSELGERFLDCIIMNGIDDEEEDDILLRVAHKAARNVKTVSDGTSESAVDPDMLRAMQLTGGYVDYLRENAGDLLARVETPEPALKRCIVLGKFVAYLRARPSKGQDEVVEREFGARLVTQMIRLATCLAVVTNKPSIADPAVLAWVRAVAEDTARGRTLDIARVIHRGTEGWPRHLGSNVPAISMRTGHSDEKQRAMLNFMRRVGIVERVPKDELPEGSKTASRWRLTKVVGKILDEVYPEDA